MIGHHAEEERTHGAQREARRQRQRDFGPGPPEIGRDRIEHHHQDEEIEGVERPAEEAGDQRVPLVLALRAIDDGRVTNERRQALIPGESAGALPPWGAPSDAAGATWSASDRRRYLPLRMRCSTS